MLRVASPLLLERIRAELRAQFTEKAEELIPVGAVAFGEMTALYLCMSKTHHFIQTPPDHSLFLLLADIAADYNIPIDLHMEAIPQDTPLPDLGNPKKIILPKRI